MDGFNDSRTQKRRTISKDNARETRSFDLNSDKPENTVKPAKSIQELIENEMKLEGSYKKELSDTTENGNISESMLLLSMAQREELFKKKCSILNRYMSAFANEYEKYRRSIFNLKIERDEYGEERYKKGVSHGYASGEKDKTEELSPRINAAEKTSKKLRIYLWLMIALEAFTVAISVIIAT